MVQEQETKNQSESALDLKKLTSDNKKKDFAREIPKGALLHVHPGGTRSEATIKQILEKVNPLINVQEECD